MMHSPRGMTPFEQRVETAIGSLAFWQGHRQVYRVAASPVASPVHRAVASDCVLVEADGIAPVFLKIRHADMKADILPQAAQAARKAASLGVAPEVLVEADGLLGLAFLPAPWRYARMGDLQDELLMARVTSAKKRLHDAKPLGHRFCPFDRIATLAAEARESGAALPEGTDRLVADAALIHEAVRAAGQDLRFCHNSGIASDIMLGDGGAVNLVDFDLAGDNDPWFDLGALINEVCCFDLERRAAIEHYAGRCDASIYNRCRLYGAVDSIMWGLWGVVRAATSQRPGIEFYKYGLWRLFHARTITGSSDFEVWLRGL